MLASITRLIDRWKRRQVRPVEVLADSQGVSIVLNDAVSPQFR